MLHLLRYICPHAETRKIAELISCEISDDALEMIDKKWPPRRIRRIVRLRTLAGCVRVVWHSFLRATVAVFRLKKFVE